MPVRNASVVWAGDLKRGRGRMSLGSGGFEGDVSYASRFEQGRGTNPEELIGAAHASCFSMALAGALAASGFEPRSIRTQARVRFDASPEPRIVSVMLSTAADVPGIDERTFRQHAEAARRNCPVSRALTGVEIVLEAALERPGE